MKKFNHPSGLTPEQWLKKYRTFTTPVKWLQEITDEGDLEIYYKNLDVEK